MIKKSFLFLVKSTIIVFVLVSCSNSNDSVYGKWQNDNNGSSLQFNKDGTVECVGFPQSSFQGKKYYMLTKVTLDQLNPSGSFRMALEISDKNPKVEGLKVIDDSNLYFHEIDGKTLKLTNKGDGSEYIFNKK